MIQYEVNEAMILQLMCRSCLSHGQCPYWFQFFFRGAAAQRVPWPPHS